MTYRATKGSKSLLISLLAATFPGPAVLPPRYSRLSQNDPCSTLTLRATVGSGPEASGLCADEEARTLLCAREFLPAVTFGGIGLESGRLVFAVVVEGGGAGL